MITQNKVNWELETRKLQLEVLNIEQQWCVQRIQNIDFHKAIIQKEIKKLSEMDNEEKDNIKEMKN